VPFYIQLKKLKKKKKERVKWCIRHPLTGNLEQMPEIIASCKTTLKNIGDILASGADDTNEEFLETTQVHSPASVSLSVYLSVFV
jgi:hypothetical protein